MYTGGNTPALGSLAAHWVWAQQGLAGPPRDVSFRPEQHRVTNPTLREALGSAGAQKRPAEGVLRGSRTPPGTSPAPLTGFLPRERQIH